VVCFGAGAIGSQLALLLAESGIGKIDLLDSDFVRPGNAVRHLAGRSDVGRPKNELVVERIREHAPWADARAIPAGSLAPDRVASSVSGADLVIDSTGHGPLIEVLSRIAERGGVGLVSAALFRGGSVARVRRQVAASDTPIHARSGDARYLLIPPGNPTAEESLEAGCSSPVNNAPPTAVATVAALATQMAIDAILARFEYPDEVIEVYRPLSQPPLDRIGRVTSGE
jgi:molybdopterin/thiamine biosynthesis adenylyltransferase